MCIFTYRTRLIHVHLHSIILVPVTERGGQRAGRFATGLHKLRVFLLSDRSGQFGVHDGPSGIIGGQVSVRVDNGWWWWWWWCGGDDDRDEKPRENGTDDDGHCGTSLFALLVERGPIVSNYYCYCFVVVVCLWHREQGSCCCLFAELGVGCCWRKTRAGGPFSITMSFRY